MKTHTILSAFLGLGFLIAGANIANAEATSPLRQMASANTDESSTARPAKPGRTEWLLADKNQQDRRPQRTPQEQCMNKCGVQGQQCGIDNNNDWKKCWPLQQACEKTCGGWGPQEGK